MSTIKDGGPAFPRSATKGTSGTIVREAQDGMSLRTYLAGQALAGLCVPGPDDGSITAWDFDLIAPVAWKAADAMLAAREAKP